MDSDEHVRTTLIVSDRPGHREDEYCDVTHIVAREVVCHS